MSWDGMEGAQHPGPGTGHPDVPAGDVPSASSCPPLRGKCLGFAQESQQAYTYIYIFNIEFYVYALEKYFFYIYCFFVCMYCSFLWSNVKIDFYIYI